MNKFFMLYREGGRSPTVKHSAEGDAKREAERIAREHGGPVYLLEARAKVAVRWESAAVSSPVAAPTVTVMKFPGEWVVFGIGRDDMRVEIQMHPTLRLAGINSDPDVEVDYAGSGCHVRALTQFGADWLAQRKARPEPNGPPTPEQAKAHAEAHDVGCIWGRWLYCASGLNGPPVPVCVDDRGIVVSAPMSNVLVGRAAHEFGGKWFPLAIDGSPLPVKDPHDDDIPF